MTITSNIITADVVYMHLASRGLSLKYQTTFKKLVRIHLLNSIVTVNQVIQINQFLHAQVIYVKSNKNHNTENTNSNMQNMETSYNSMQTRELEQVEQKQQYIILPSSKISFKSYNICDKTSTSMGSRVYAHPHRDEIISILNSRVIASSAFLSSIVDSITSSIQDSQSLSQSQHSMSKGRGNREGSEGNENSMSIQRTLVQTGIGQTGVGKGVGIMLQSHIGGGKSTVLKALYEAYGSQNAYYLKCRELIGENR